MSPSEVDVIRVEIESHGIHHIIIMAEDIMGNDYIDHVTVSANLEIHWIEENTHEPRSLLIDSIPSNHGVAADVIVIESIVRNPELIQGLGSGQSVEFSWDLIDKAQIACQSRDGEVDDGEGDASDEEVSGLRGRVEVLLAALLDLEREVSSIKGDVVG